MVTKLLVILGWLIGLLSAKFLVVWFVGRKMGLNDIASRNMAAVLPQGGEFAFVLFGLAPSEEVLTPAVRDYDCGCHTVYGTDAIYSLAQ